MAKATGISKRRQRKIDHIKSLAGKKAWPKGRLRQKALHHMNMPAEDVQAAMGKIY
jgi:hypothetical protein